jgi:hypothetical protein
MDRFRLDEPVNTATGPQDARPPAGGRRVMSTGVAITLIAVGARFFAPDALGREEDDL